MTNTGNQAAWVLCHLAQNSDWYGRVREEVDTVIASQRQLTGAEDATALQILQQMSMESWEKDFPLVDLALRESIRLNMAGVSFRLNIASENVEIAGGSKEIIPPRTYAVCIWS